MAETQKFDILVVQIGKATADLGWGDNEIRHRLDNMSWMDQWERVKRFGLWIDEIYSSNNTLDQARSSDVVYSFFINCFHLKDWISNYDSSLKTGVNNLFKRDIGEEHLKICADIANGAKHFQLDNRRRTNQEPRVTAESVNMHQVAAKLSIGGSVEVRKEAIPSGGSAYGFMLGDYDAQELKDRCMYVWEKYLQSNGLI